MKPALCYLILAIILLTACTSVDLEAPIPIYDPGVNPESWVVIPAGEYLAGQHNDSKLIDYDYEIMVTDVTAAQYIDFLNAALADGT
jgi:hypothetical protein